MTSDDGAPPRFLARWTGWTLLGWVAGIGVTVALAQMCDALGFEDVQCVTGIGVGVGIGAAQALPLLPRLGGWGPWFRATAVGMGAPFVAADLVRAAGIAEPDLLFCAVAGALVAGALQARVLAGAVRGAWRWMAASVAGWGVAALAVLASAVTAKLAGDGWRALAAVIATWIAGGALFALVTGAALSRMLWPPRAPPG